MSLKQKRPAFLDAIESASMEDLQAIDDRLAELDREGDLLRQARRVLAAKFEPPRERKKPGPKKNGHAANGAAPSGGGKGSAWQSYREKIAKYLAHMGPKKQAVIAEDCDVPAGSIYAVLEHEWFKRDGGAIHLTNEGRQAIN